MEEVCRGRPLHQVTFIIGNLWWLEKENVTLIFSKGQGGRSRGLQTSKSHLSLWEDYGKSPHGSPCQKRLTKNKSYPNSWTNFNDDTSSMDERTAASWIEWTPLLPNWEGNAWMATGPQSGGKNWLDFWAWRRASNEQYFSLGWYQSQIYLIASSATWIMEWNVPQQLSE